MIDPDPALTRSLLGKTPKKAAKKATKKAKPAKPKRLTAAQKRKKAAATAARLKAKKKVEGKARAPRKKKAAKVIRAAVSTVRKKRAADSASKKFPSKGGRKPFVPTDEQREIVLVSVGLGFRQEEIVLLIKNPVTGESITEKTLRLHFKHEIESGVALVKLDVGRSIVKRARDLQHPQGATCAIFFAKTRMGWKERQVVEVENKSGVLIPPPNTTPEDWIAAATAVANRKPEPGTED